MKKNIFILLVCIFPLSVSAQVSQENIHIFENFSQVVESRFPAGQQKDTYKRLASMIDVVINRQTTTDIHRKRLEDIRKLSYEKIFEMKLMADMSNNLQIMKESNIQRAGTNIKGLTAYSELQDIFTYFITEDRNFLQQGEVWKGIYFNNYASFSNEYGVNKRDLIANNISITDTPIYRDSDGRYHFIPQHRKQVILGEDVFFGLPEKYHLLQNLHDDMRYVSQNPEQTLREIQQITQQITAGKNDTQKIAAIYNYILDNLSYSEGFQLDDMYIYSGIEAFKRGSAVCTGYVKLMAYMLGFAGISDFEVIRGYIVDADDFPHIGHAWLRIGDYYYDPTFDDPVGGVNTRTRNEYRYFGLPRDIMYTNRFEYGTLPEVLKSLDIEQRKQYVKNMLNNIYPKYQNQAKNYRLFDEITFRRSLSIGIHSQISVPMLTTHISYIQVNTNNHTYMQDGKQRQIYSLEYYVLTNQNIETILDKIRYDFTDYTLIKWYTSDDIYEWRLGFNMVGN